MEDRRVLAPFVVTNTDDLPVAAANDAPGTLRQAIFDANNSSGVDTIEFNLAFPATIVLDEGQLAVTQSVHINGPGAELLAIDASGNDTTPTQNEGNGSRIFEFVGPNAIDATISGLKLRGGDEFDDGGAIWLADALTISDCVLTDNAATSGGAIFVSQSSTLNVVRTLIDTNYAFGSGGGIFAESDTTTIISDSEISNNRAGNESNIGGQHGGGISVTSVGLHPPSNLIVARSLIDGNSAPHGIGGGIFYQNFGPGQGVLEIRESRITNNLANDGTYYAIPNADPAILPGGGGVYAYSDGSVLITHSTIDNNHAFGRGGGLDLNDSSATIINTTISSNESMEGGGVWASNALFKHCTITLNRAGIEPAETFVDDYPKTFGGAGGLHIGWVGGGVTAGTVLDHTIVAGNFHDWDPGQEWLDISSVPTFSR